MITQVHPNVEELMSMGKQRGFITYDELIRLLPDEMVEPDRIDELLVQFEGLSVRLMQSDQTVVRPRAKAPPPAPIPTDLGREFIADEDEPDPEVLKQDLAEALQEANTRRIDDPVRMYLTQMGEISLLTRDEEIRLAKKIETTRMIFRRKVLENDYAAAAAVEILEMVQAGSLPFDRTMKISTAEENAKEKIATRIPENLKTVRHLLDLNRQDWQLLEEPGRRAKSETEAIHHRLTSRRRKISTLLEELSLRTSKILPLFKRMKAISHKMAELERQLEQANQRPERFDPEDVMVMGEELTGLVSLVLGKPEDLKAPDRSYYHRFR